ncbi:MAG TPA: helix-turn-helix domain-containing protein [Candidatus Dormibacteraeota bacterium]
MPRVREIRLERARTVPAAFTLAAVAARAGVSVTTLRKWELGQARPRVRAAKALAKALGVKVEDLGLDDQARDADDQPVGEDSVSDPPQ